jgi:AcrR family transcriptional regulator
MDIRTELLIELNKTQDYLQQINSGEEFSSHIVFVEEALHCAQKALSSESEAWIRHSIEELRQVRG